MKRLVILGALAAATLVVAAAQEQRPVFRGRGDAVRVFVTVTDRDGRLVPDLTRDDFEVRDEGKPQPLVLFDNTPQPIRLVSMLDVSGSMSGNLDLLRQASGALFARLRRDDLVRVGTFGRRVEISPEFTRDPQQLRAALPQEIEPDAPTPLWKGVDEAMDTFGDDAEQRRVVLVLSDGKDTGPTVSSDFKRHVASQGEVIDRARGDNVMVYAVGMRSRPQRGQNRPMGPVPVGPMGGMGGMGGGLGGMLAENLPDPGLARVAEDTGGGYLEIRYGEDLAGAFERVADELHSQYLLGFAPPKRDGKVHHIEVRLKKAGLKARGQKSYVAPKDAS